MGQEEPMEDRYSIEITEQDPIDEILFTQVEILAQWNQDHANSTDKIAEVRDNIRLILEIEKKLRV